MNEKGQGALEYLIIVAAVLAIAAVVVTVLTGVLGGGQQSTTVNEVKNAASDASSSIASEGGQPGEIYFVGTVSGATGGSTAVYSSSESNSYNAQAVVANGTCSDWATDAKRAPVPAKLTSSGRSNLDQIVSNLGSDELGLLRQGSVSAEENVESIYGACLAGKPEWITQE